MIRINEITDIVSTYIDDPDMDLIRRAYVFSARAHEGQVRLSGEPYLSHPLHVAKILADMRMDEPTVAAGLLHDTVEDTDTTIDEIADLFGEEVADIVDGVTKIGMMDFESKAIAKAENIRKMILAMAEDIRVLMVKLADRLHNMSTLDFQKSYKQLLIAQETLDIYSPLANRLGLYMVKRDLEDLCLYYLKPDIYQNITDGLERQHTLGKEYVDKVLGLLHDVLESNELKGSINGRTKHKYSIYNKMTRQGLELDEVHDIIAFRVVVESVKECYAVLGLVHSMWMPVAGRFKDYISIPKANMYQSLHTTVVGPEGERIEIQIRTEEMQKVAEYGVAAHWQYKESGTSSSKQNRDAERFSWLRQIMDWQRELEDPREFMSSLRFDLFNDEVYIFTPGGDIKELPDGATPVDFAYSIHTDVGNHCTGAKVNGRLVPLTTGLKNGDTVEIFTDKKRKPSRDWLKFVKTAKARTRIKHYIRTEEREHSISLAKEMLEKEGRRMNLNVPKAVKDGYFVMLADEFSCGNVDDLLSNIGYSRITPKKVLRRLYAVINNIEGEPEEAEIHEPQVSEDKSQNVANSIEIEGVDNVLIRFAGCCTPLPGEPIIGYISRGRGVVVHAATCPNVKSLEEERLLSVSWSGGQEEASHPAQISIRCKNIKGLLAKICSVLAEQDVNIDSGTFKSDVDGISLLEFTVEVRDLGHLHRALNRLKTIDAVLETTRIS
ncbi:GTP pyrophosphokinase [Maridesulfovibrio ferrireducens]|uniref:GTP pyrophosphokinase n=1 Tax=Maridesulfovibrio ferrireducens TaxID=246191 RepID=A0A1G9JRM1_9BACT|nr:bifunctional (p)ppGpp synthetase/guanosine-3',5'-bis(diphosphate) 3'-pyrophosphohydrolase [Maridesulfovibrio ferrireducens]SDL39936.1 GTP pyrophosphokinase [Maridesulfovibrio ferrireducens]